MDVHLRKTRRSKAGADSDSDSDEVPLDPDDPNPPPPPVKKEPKSAGEAKEINVSIRKADDKGAQSFTGGLTAARREMLHILREEEDEAWEDYEYFDGEVCHFKLE